MAEEIGISRLLTLLVSVAKLEYAARYVLVMLVAMSLRSSRKVRSSSDKLKTTTDAAASGVGRAVPPVS